jgi:hypothetical protein
MIHVEYVQVFGGLHEDGAEHDGEVRGAHFVHGGELAHGACAQGSGRSNGRTEKKKRGRVEQIKKRGRAKKID